MNRNLRQLIIASEDKLRWYRSPTGSPTGLRFVRVAHAGPDSKPPRRIGCYRDAECLGYTTANGVLSRVFYVLAGNGPDGIPDGCGEWSADDRYKGEPADPAALAAKQPLRPPSLDRSSEATIADEIKARAEVVAYWARVAAEQAEAKRMQAAQAAEQRAAPVIVAAPTPKPPRKWWQLF